MNYCNIKYTDIANGLGVRTSLFVSGCRNHCDGCFQSETWDFNYGKKFTIDVENEIIESLKPHYIQGLTILGGDPFEVENQKVLVSFIETINKKYPTKDIWMYTGYLFDKDIANKKGKQHILNCTDKILKNIDVLVDGRFIKEKKNLMLKFRGSENQRIIDVKNSTKDNIVLLNI